MEGEDEDIITLLDTDEDTEFTNFNPTVMNDSTWEAGYIINNYLEKNFNQEMLDTEKESIIKDFPKPACKVLIAPKLDKEMKVQIKKTGKDPQFGAQRSLYSLQQQLLDVAGPLTCLWVHMADQNAKVNPSAASQPQKEGKEVKQVAQQINTVCMLDQCFLKNIIIPISCTHLLAAGWLLYCVKTWQTIITDQWVLQVVKGYKLELLAAPSQQSQPSTVVTKGIGNTCGLHGAANFTSFSVFPLVYAVPAEYLPSTSNPVLGFLDRFQRDANQADKGKGDTASVVKQGSPASFSPGISLANFKMIATLPSCLPGTVVVLRVTTSEEPSHSEVPVLQPASVIEPGSPDGVEVVVNQNGASQQKEYTDAGTGLDSGNGHIIVGLGCHLQGHTNRGPMVPGTAHKLLGTASSHFCCESIHQGSERYTHPSANGQPDGLMLCEPLGRDMFPDLEQTGSPAVAMMPRKEPVPVSRVLTRSGQLRSRSEVKINPVVSRVAPEARSIPGDNGSCACAPTPLEILLLK